MLGRWQDGEEVEEEKVVDGGGGGGGKKERKKDKKSIPIMVGECGWLFNVVILSLPHSSMEVIPHHTSPHSLPLLQTLTLIFNVTLAPSSHLSNITIGNLIS